MFQKFKFLFPIDIAFEYNFGSYLIFKSDFQSLKLDNFDFYRMEVLTLDRSFTQFR